MNKKVICVTVYTLDSYGTVKEQKILKSDEFDDDELEELWDEYEIDPTDMDEITLAEVEELLF